MMLGVLLRTLLAVGCAIAAMAPQTKSPARSGVVTTLLGEPIPDAAVTLHAADGVERTVRTDGTGRFVVDLAEDFAGTVAVAAKGFVTYGWMLLPHEWGGRACLLQVQLHEVGVALRGTVSDGAGKPVRDAVVGMGAARCTSDAEGRYALSGLPQGLLPLAARHPAAGVATARVDTRVSLKHDFVLGAARAPLPIRAPPGERWLSK